MVGCRSVKRELLLEEGKIGLMNILLHSMLSVARVNASSRGWLILTSFLFRKFVRMVFKLELNSCKHDRLE